MSFQPQGQGPPTLTRGLLESETELHELFAKFVFVVPVSSAQGFLSLLLCWVSFAFSFHHMSFQQVGLLLGLVSTSLGPSWGCFSQVTSETWHPHVRGVYNFLGSVSLQQRFEIEDQCYSSVIAQEFFSANKGMRVGQPQRWGLNLSFLLLYICLLPSLSLPYARWASQGGACFFHLKFSLQSTDFLLFHFCSLFCLSLSHHHFGILFPILTTQQYHIVRGSILTEITHLDQAPS